ncbi:L-glutamate gamma-semialdehyde dehydrogenase [candidate division KSB1 bacterium]|nr:MAG: L-glutamate gamma-semialdehyde dehydrogenase [candidate division KSB1 bacterium]
MKVEFKNTPLIDFSVEENRKKMEEALDYVSSQFGNHYDIVINGEKVKTGETFNSINPSNKDEIVGVFEKADIETANKAVEAASDLFKSWKNVDPFTRARYLWKAAEIMRRRRIELAAWMVMEEGKNWIEADADVAEAIDFLEFYGREMVRLGLPQPLTRRETEDNELYYIPLGAGAVIPPWNFPLAILVGMTSAAFVSGNTVVLKPASTAPTIAAKFMEILDEACLPPGVVNFLPGPGGKIGDSIVSHPKTRFIAFTGSKEVGLRINELAAKTSEGQIWIKRVILEMGGKDLIIVDKVADFDDAAGGIVASAFGYQGQKCSACSRAIILEDVYDMMVEKIVERTKNITVGPVKDQNNYMGPVIDKWAYEKILEMIEVGKKEGKLVIGGNKAPGNGFFIQPTIFKDVPPDARIAQEEIFGPVLAIIKAKDFDDALEIANGTEYGLTGSVYSRDRINLEKARRDLHVGNLYFNRKCTGALVGVHPFGGFNMSGTDSKAGGRDYLLLFTQAKAVSEIFK